MRKISLLIFLLAFPLDCFAQDIKLDAETKQLCDKVMDNIYKDISKIKDNYKGLKNFDESVLKRSDFNELNSIKYSYNIKKLTKGEGSIFGENAFSFSLQFTPINETWRNRC